MKNQLLQLVFLIVTYSHATTAWGQFNINAGSTNYVQNFDSLTSGTWTNNTTPITGWYVRTTATASITSYSANTGSTTTAGFYAFGVAGTNALSDRSIGFVTSNAYTGAAGSGLNYIGWRLKNNTGSEIISLTITYTGEQWRKDNTVNQTLNVDYQTGSSVTDVTSGTWTSIGALTFTSPVITSGAATLDGNASVNRVTGITASITVSIPAGEEIMIRWTDLNDSGNDHSLAIDDVTINATVAAIPGTSTLTSGPTAEPVSFSSLINTQGAAVVNFDFTIQDDGASPSADALATQLSQLRFRQGIGNDVSDWTVALLGVELSDGATTQTGTINATNITFASIPNAVGQLGYIADNTSKTYLLKVWLKTDVGALKTTIDGSNLVFRLINADFTITGSQLAPSQDVNSGSTNNTISVTATVLAFAQNASNTDVNNNMSPAPTVSANDANGNRDLDFSNSVSITSTGTLNSTPQTASANMGLATFTINHTAVATARTLTASSGGFSNIVSNSFDITAVTNATAIAWAGAASCVAGTSQTWLTAANWCGAAIPSAASIAQFGSTGSASTIGFNMNGATLAQRTIGAIEFSSGAIARTINNSSGTVANNFILAGVAVNGFSNTVLRNNSANTMTIADGSSQTLGLNFSNVTNNNVSIESTGGITVSCIISGSNPVTKIGSGSGVLLLTGANTYTGLTTVSAGTLQLNKSGGTTLPITNNITINGGTLKVSSNQTLNNLVLISGSLVVDASVTLTINGTFSISGGTITNNGTIAYGASGTLLYNTGISQTIATEWPSTNGPANITLQGANTQVSLTANRTINGALTLTNGILSIGSNTLTLNGTISGSGAIAGSSTSNLTVGAVVGTINFATGSRTLQHLLIGTGSNAGLTLGTALDIAPTGGISFNVSGTKTLSTAGNTLTLKSTSAGTAYIGNLNGATINGNITAECFVSNAGRRWRFFASPFSDATFEDLRQEIYITGAGVGNTAGTLNSNGFDATLSNQPSVYSYTESSAGSLNTGWTALTNSTSSLANQIIIPGRGYRIFIRGDRSDVSRLTGVNLTSSAVTVNTSGTINSGSITMPVTYTVAGGQANDGWNLLGNPYPSAYDWNAFRDNNVGITNIDSTIYIFDATSGSYKSYNSNSGGSLTNGIIPQGASFWVKANAASPALTLTEQFKTTTQPIALFKNDAADELKLVLTRDTATSDIFILAHHDGSTMNKDGYDITKLAGEINLMSRGNDGIDLTYDARPVMMENDTVNLYVSGGNNTYSLAVKSLPLLSGKHYFLLDKKLGSISLLAVDFTFNFTTSMEDSSSFGNRFQLIISSNSALPVTFQKFTAIKQHETVLLNWTTTSEINNHYFEVEKSGDGKVWQAFNRVEAAGNSNLTRNYQTIDESPNTQFVNYYRIKQVDFDNRFSYSPVRVVSFGDSQLPEMQLQPNPANNKVKLITVSMIQNITLTDCNGKQLLETNQPSFNIGGLQSGIYFVRITTDDGLVVNQELLKVNE